MRKGDVAGTHRSMAWHYNSPIIRIAVLFSQRFQVGVHSAAPGLPQVLVDSTELWDCYYRPVSMLCNVSSESLK